MTSEVVGGGSTDSPSVDSEACTVALDAFSGPLDLLLYLVRRAEVDIIDIPVASIADQFIAAVDAWAEVDLDVAGDFILMAASLLELKARLVAPPLDEATPDEAEEEVIDLRAGLVGKLLAYRRCKEAALTLERLEESHRPRLARQLHEAIPDDPDEEGIDLENADPYALAASFEAVMARIHGLGPRTVVADPLPLEAAITLLIETLQAQGEERLSQLLATQPTRLGRVTVLMALLECARQRLIEVVQPEQYGDVRLRFRAAPERDAEAVLPPPEPEGPKRRKRPPLMTWSGVISDAEHDAAAPEEPLESDEQRFMRELEETCALEAALARAADIDGSFAKFWAERRGLPWPPPPEPVAPAPVAAVAAPPPVRARRERQRPAPAADPVSATAGALPARVASDVDSATAPTQPVIAGGTVVTPAAEPVAPEAIAPAHPTPAIEPNAIAANISAAPPSACDPIPTAETPANLEARVGEPTALAAGTVWAAVENAAAPVEVATVQPLVDAQPQVAADPAPLLTAPAERASTLAQTMGAPRDEGVAGTVGVAAENAAPPVEIATAQPLVGAQPQAAADPAPLLTAPAAGASTLAQAMNASRDESVVVEVAADLPGSQATEAAALTSLPSGPAATPDPLSAAQHAAFAAPVAVEPPETANAPSAELPDLTPHAADSPLPPEPVPASPAPDALVDPTAAEMNAAAGDLAAHPIEPAMPMPSEAVDEPTTPSYGASHEAPSDRLDDVQGEERMDAPIIAETPAMTDDAPPMPLSPNDGVRTPMLRAPQPAAEPVAARPPTDPPRPLPTAPTAPTTATAPLAAPTTSNEPAAASPAQSPLAEAIRQARAATPVGPAVDAMAPLQPAPAKRPAVRTEVLAAEPARAGSLPSTRTRGTTLHPFPAPLRGATRPWRARAAFSATLLVLAGGWWMLTHHRESVPTPVEAPPEVMRLPLGGPAAMGPGTPPLDVRAFQQLMPIARLLIDGLVPLFTMPAAPAQPATSTKLPAQPPARASTPATVQAAQLLQDLCARASAFAAWFARTFPERALAAPSTPAPLTIAVMPPAATPVATPARTASPDEHWSTALAADALAAFALDPAARAALQASAEAACTPLEPASDPARAYPWLGDGMTSTSAWLMLHDARDLP